MRKDWRAKGCAWLCAVLTLAVGLGGHARAAEGALEALPVVDGEVVMEENWIVAIGNIAAQDRRIGQTIPMPGFAPDTSDDGVYTQHARARYLPTSADSAISQYSIGYETGSPAENARAFHGIYDLAFGDLGMQSQPLLSASLHGQTVHYFFSEALAQEDTAGNQERPETSFAPERRLYLWMPAFGDDALTIQVDSYPDAGEQPPSEADMLAFAEEVMQTITLFPLTPGEPLPEMGRDVTFVDGWILSNAWERAAYKLGEVEAAPGFVPDGEVTTSIDASFILQAFASADTGGRGIHYYVVVLNSDAETAAQNAHNNFTEYYPSLDISPVRSATLHGRAVVYFTTDDPPAEALSGEAAQQIIVYVPAAGGMAVLIGATVPYADGFLPMDEAELLALAESILQGITLVE